ncbi:MAG TPA: alpha/beta fold hydrolase [Micromonosporaceae bacterium]
MKRILLLAVVTAAALSGCTAGSTSTGATRPAGTTGPAGAAGRGLADRKSCPGETGFTCGTLTVPLDRAHPSHGSLALNVAVGDDASARRGVLLALTGGPGQPGAGLLSTVAPRLAGFDAGYQLVMIDQRGTGGTAIDCPQLQSQVGSSDIAPATPAAVTACARTIGTDRAFYTTADTVADLDQLRSALGIDAWTIDGVSYGSYVAQRYAYAHPRHVTKLVLDSVVPANGVPALYRDSLHRTATVLRDACRTVGCPGDPAADVASIVAASHDGARLFDFLVTASIVDPTFAGDNYYPVLPLLHRAARGDTRPLRDAITDLESNQSNPGFAAYSSGLHAATICPELAEAPWVTPSAALPRDRAVTAAESTITPGSVWPFDPATAIEQGIVNSCRYWPPTRPVPPVTGRLTMPVLMINGDHDLSTPLPWAQSDLAHFTDAKLVVVTGMGHSVQGRNAQGDAAVKAFLSGAD